MNRKLIQRTQRPALRFAATLMVWATLLATFVPVVPVRAVDVQALPLDTRAYSGYTHGALVTWDDLNAADASVVVLQLFAIPTNTYIDRVGFQVIEAFTNAAYATGVDAGSNLVMTVGVGGTTNAFFGSNTLIAARSTLATNMLIASRATTSTNYLIATFSDGIQASAVDNYLVGKVRIYWRLVDLSKARF